MLYTAADVENQIVQATLSHSGQAHRFNKVRIQGNWHNVDAFIDDVERGELHIVGHGYCLFSDDYASRVYDWDREAYPEAKRENNWHQRKNLVATNQEELEALVAEGIEKGQCQISLWIPAYTRDAFDFTFLRQNPKVESYTAMATHNWPMPEKDDVYPSEAIFVPVYN